MVGGKFCNIFQQLYFWQHTLMNVPFRSVNNLKVSRNIPEYLKLFVYAINANGSFWHNTELVKSYLEKDGHRNYYVNNFINYLQGMFNTLTLWVLQVFRYNRYFNTITNVLTASLALFLCIIIIFLLNG